MYQKEKNRNEIWEFVKAAFFFYFAVMGFLLSIIGDMCGGALFGSFFDDQSKNKCEP